MSIRYCCSRQVMPGRFCPSCGRSYAHMPLTRSVSTYDDGPSIGIDVTDGDPVLNLGGGLGIDLDTGQVEVDFGGVDIPLGDI